MVRKGSINIEERERDGERARNILACTRDASQSLSGNRFVENMRLAAKKISCQITVRYIAEYLLILYHEMIYGRQLRD